MRASTMMRGFVNIRRSRDQDIRRLLRGSDIKAFSEAPKVLCMEDAGDAAPLSLAQA